MTSYAHIWLAYMALELLKSRQGSFQPSTNDHLENFLYFTKEHPSVFICSPPMQEKETNNPVRQGQAWKCRFSEDGIEIQRRPPAYNRCQSHVKPYLHKKLKLQTTYSDHPGRCEALSQSICDMATINQKSMYGESETFDSEQIAAFYFGLSQYVAEAHMPLNCDLRDFTRVSTVRQDIELYWETEIRSFFRSGPFRNSFSVTGEIQSNNNSGYKTSWVSGLVERLNNTHFVETGNLWNRLLGEGNRNLWDYLIGTYHVSFLMSHLILPDDHTDYNQLKILNSQRHLQVLNTYSPDILADAVTSIASVWLSTWIRWEMLNE